MNKTYYKDFGSYDEAYAVYSDILSGRDKDRKNPTITLIPPNGDLKINGFRVWWMMVD